MKPTARRVFLKGSVAAVTLGGGPGGAPAGPAAADARLAALAAEYWRTVRRSEALVEAAGRRLGIGTWRGDAACKARYDALNARQDRLLAAIAGTPAGGLAGLAAKMRVATLCDERSELRWGEPLEAVFPPALRDLARLAAEAGP
jgi:hypothetical protein